MSRILPVLEAISSTVNHTGPVDYGQATEAVCETLSFSEKLNQSSERLLSVVGEGIAVNWFLKHRAKIMLESQSDVGFKRSLLFKDSLTCQSLAQDLDIPVPIVDVAIKDFRVLVGLGDGDHDISGLIQLKHGLD